MRRTDCRTFLALKIVLYVINAQRTICNIRMILYVIKKNSHFFYSIRMLTFKLFFGIPSFFSNAFFSASFIAYNFFLNQDTYVCLILCSLMFNSIEKKLFTICSFLERL